MIKETLLALSLTLNISTSSLGFTTPSASFVEQKTVLAQQELGLTNRLPNSYGSEIFADNIALALHYLKNDVETLKKDSSAKILGPDDIDWEKARSRFEVSFTLKPGEVFAFHNNTLPEFKDSIAYSTNSRFFIEDGYKSLSGLGGNGVCHLASAINWVASNAGLDVTAKVNHDFFLVPFVPRENGTSIFYAKQGGNSQNQNLYVKNNFDVPVTFEFKVEKEKIALTVVK